jgi:hypothetical protein
MRWPNCPEGRPFVSGATPHIFRELASPSSFEYMSGKSLNRCHCAEDVSGHLPAMLAWVRFSMETG